MRPYRSIARVGFASLLGALAAVSGSNAQADTAPTTPPAPTAPSCDAALGMCSVGTAALHAELRNQLPTAIDSGVMDKGLIKIRTRFTIDPVAGEPLVKIDMPQGALVQASWSEKGFVNLTPVTEANAQGSIAVRYTLTPNLEASIYGFNINYDAKQLVNKIPGAKFNYDQSASGQFAPWGFAGGKVDMPAPALDKSTIYSLPFSQLGVDSETVTGSLSIQAAAKPTFNYLTKSILLDSGTITTADGVAKVAVGDADFLDVGATIAGQITVTGNLEIRPVIKIDSVYGFPTFGLTKFSFSAVTKAIGGAPVPVSFQNANIHIPLPNVKVPATPIGLGDVKAGSTALKTIMIDSTGEMAGRLEFTSSDPQFSVPSGAITVGPKSKYELKVTFKPSSDAAASATITVKSNDPDSPLQTFKVAANGASLGDENEDGKSGGKDSLDSPDSNEGCTVANLGVGTGSAGGSAALALGLGLGLAVIARRRRSA
jgi:hypothetical protein